MTDLLLGYAAIGAAAGAMALARVLRCLSDPRDPRRRRLPGIVGDARFPVWLLSLVAALVVLAVCAKVAALWPLYVRRVLR